MTYLNQYKVQNGFHKSLLEKIRNIQTQLQLTNRAILIMADVPAADESDFFKGECATNLYQRCLTTLEMILNHLNQIPFAPQTYLQQLRTLPLHNIYLRNRYAFWFSNFIQAGGTAANLVTDAKQHDTSILNQVVWSGNVLVTEAHLRHLTTHLKQLKSLSTAEYDVLQVIMTRYSDASALFFANLQSLYECHQVTVPTEMQSLLNQTPTLRFT